MSEDQIKQIKSQKKAAILLTTGAFLLLIGFLYRVDFENYRDHNYFMCLALSVLVGCGIVAFTRSNRKLKRVRK